MDDPGVITIDSTTDWGTSGASALAIAQPPPEAEPAPAAMPAPSVECLPTETLLDAIAVRTNQAVVIEAARTEILKEVRSLRQEMLDDIAQSQMIASCAIGLSALVAFLAAVSWIAKAMREKDNRRARDFQV